MPALIIILPLALLALLFYSRAAQASVNAELTSAPDPLLGPEFVPAEPAGVSLLDSIGAAVSSVARGLRNNNPGNLVASPSFTWNGQTGVDGVFAVFASAADGIRALGRNLLAYQSKYGLSTVQDIITRWAPPSENNTQAYITAVARDMGVSPTDALDLSNPDTLSSLAAAIIKHENGSQPFDLSTIQANVTRS